jgi:hypothetical protein
VTVNDVIAQRYVAGGTAVDKRGSYLTIDATVSATDVELSHGTGSRGVNTAPAGVFRTLSTSAVSLLRNTSVQRSKFFLRSHSSSYFSCRSVFQLFIPLPVPR